MSSRLSGNRSLAQNAVLNIVNTVSGMVFPLITFPYISRILGVDGIGKYSMSVSLISYFAIFASLGVSSYGIREGSQYREDKIEMSLFANQVFTINMIATAVSYLLLFLFLHFVSAVNAYKGLVLILGIQIVFSTLGSSWICNVYEDFLYITVRTLFFQVIHMVAIFIFVKEQGDLIKYTTISMIAVAAPNLLNFIYIRNRYVKIHLVKKCEIKKHLKPIVMIFISSIAISIYVNSDITILGILKTDYDVGIYSVAVKMYNIEKGLIGAVVTVLLPRLSLMIKTKNRMLNLQVSKSIILISTIAIPCIVGICMLSNDFVTIFAGEQYIDSAPILRALSIAALFSLFAYFFSYAILIPFNLENIVLKASLLSALSNIVLNLIFIPLFGTICAAFTTAFSEFLQAMITGYYAFKHVKLIEIKKDTLTILLGSIGICLICFAGILLIPSQMLRVSSTVIASIVVYFFVLYIRESSLFQEFKK